ncbi:hypothetical protein VNO78_06360 [Psophocarpus tetragonolobus]|uniref:Uncharacterized protein n=1 Tax=Psophocarpus tetragonolobus TaxID=3891 RepID=A0AAN9SSB5_PSOTE
MTGLNEHVLHCLALNKTIFWNSNLVALQGVKRISKILSCVGKKDIESHDMLKQGFTHAFLMTLERGVHFQSNPNHVGFSRVFSSTIEKIVVLDFPTKLVKAPK